MNFLEKYIFELILRITSQLIQGKYLHQWGTDKYISIQFIVFLKRLSRAYKVDIVYFIHQYLQVKEAYLDSRLERLGKKNKKYVNVHL